MNDHGREVAGMFDRISPTYDFLNHLLSLGIDRRWRAVAVRAMDLRPGMRILDCSAGTGDLSLEAHSQADRVETVLLDPAHAMLIRADSKAGTIAPEKYRLIRGVAECLPFRAESFDRFMVAFGIRNFSDLTVGLSELHRVLKVGGTGCILEFTPDRSRFINRSFRWYMKNVMMPVGAIISRDRDAYSYLARTIENFSSAQALREELSQVGFAHRTELSLSFGIARIFVVERAS